MFPPKGDILETGTPEIWKMGETSMRLILASQSPRRRELLTQLGLQFQIDAAGIDETMDPSHRPFDEVSRLARDKSLAVPAAPDDVVIAADTVVVLDNTVLGKPKDPADAVRMLHALSNRSHEVMTGLAVRQGSVIHAQTVVTEVWFRSLTDAEITAYVSTGEPLDKAGAYGIQGLAAGFVTRLEGDYYNVVGLPLCPLVGLLRQAGVEVLGC